MRTTYKSLLRNTMADMGFIEALNSINSKEKKNLIRDSDSPAAAEKLYPPFPVARSLSYSSDCILLVNELNRRGLNTFGVTNLMHYEFLLYCISPKKRYTKWVKPEKNETIEHIMEQLCLTYEKARDYYDILDDKSKKTLDKMYASKIQLK